MSDALDDRLRALLAQEATWSRPSTGLRRAVLRAALREAADREAPPAGDAGDAG